MNKYSFDLVKVWLITTFSLPVVFPIVQLESIGIQTGDLRNHFQVTTAPLLYFSLQRILFLNLVVESDLKI